MPSVRIDSSTNMDNNQNMCGENEQQHALATMPPLVDGDLRNPQPADIEAIIQHWLQQERMAWGVEREEHDQARSSRARHPPHQLQLYYIENGESYSDTKDMNPMFVMPAPRQRVNAQKPSVHSDPIVAAMQQQLNDFKNFMETEFPASITPIAQ
ncbi:hypothetical protein LIER_37081 [Lithospermum erythrorhizon]|uniref:Uncharacterized protein n=1 Tax=Lithospermum erythrorhizon TaxID=34254 RepID=A0AAV3PF13_LITER